MLVLGDTTWFEQRFQRSQFKPLFIYLFYIRTSVYVQVWTKSAFGVVIEQWGPVLWAYRSNWSTALSPLFSLQSPSCGWTPADAWPWSKHPKSQETHLAVRCYRGSPHCPDSLCCIQPNKDHEPGPKSSTGLCCWEPPVQPGEEPAERLL